MDRRRFLCVLGVGSVTGCLASEGPSSTPTDGSVGSPTSTAGDADPGTIDSTGREPEATVDASCSSDRERSEIIPETVEYDRYGGFTLRASESTVTRGDSLVVNLTNEAGTELQTGNRSAYTIHRAVPDGWRSIFWKSTDPRPVVDADSIAHPPGDGYTWELTISRKGLTHEIENGLGSLAVCTPITPGTYRFLFWGGIDGVEGHIATRFTVSES